VGTQFGEFLGTVQMFVYITGTEMFSKKGKNRPTLVTNEILIIISESFVLLAFNLM
jgi:hypothetical protein